MMIHIKKQLERKFGILDLSERSRKKEMVAARSVFVRLAMEMPKYYSRLRIGNIVGLDNASVIHSERMFDTYMGMFPHYHDVYKVMSQKKNRSTDVSDLIDRIHDLEDRLQVRNRTVRGDLVELLKEVPEHHLDTVKMRLEPIIKMLPR